MRGCSIVAALGLAFVWGCGKTKEDETAIVKALGAEKKQAEGPSSEALEKRRSERLAREQEAKEAERRMAEAIDAVATAPEVRIKDLKKACKAVAAAHDEYMNRHLEAEELDKWEQSKTFQLDMTRRNCVKHGSLEIAACQKHAFDSAPAELLKEVPAILMRCIDKYSAPP